MTKQARIERAMIEQAMIERPIERPCTRCRVAPPDGPA